MSQLQEVVAAGAGPRAKAGVRMLIVEAAEFDGTKLDEPPCLA
jgi:hypothetical protein